MGHSHSPEPTRKAAMPSLSPQRAAEWRRTAARSVPSAPAEDARTRPAYQAARGMTTLANGGRKRLAVLVAVTLDTADGAIGTTHDLARLLLECAPCALDYGSMTPAEQRVADVAELRAIADRLATIAGRCRVPAYGACLYATTAKTAARCAADTLCDAC